jgi:cytochrome oxidase Cu insertion factor (SCO1/SenC/PrrC family)
VTTVARELRFRNLRTLAALAALFFMPLLASAWLYYGMGWRPAGQVNHGELIQPPRPLPRVAADPTLFRGEWTLVYIGDGSCDASCRGTLYVMRQTRLALGTDQTRVARVFLVTKDCCAQDYLAREHAGMTVFDAAGAAGAALLGRFPPGDEAHTLFVVDPLGNLMMRYDVRHQPRGLLVDLKRLLELSQIG